MQNPHTGFLTSGMRAIMEGKAKLKPLESSLPRKIINPKQYCIPGGPEMQSGTWKIQDISFYNIQFNTPIWPMQNTDRSWRITVEYHKLNRWCLQLQLLYQMLFQSLRKLIPLLVPGTQLLSWQMAFYPSLSIRSQEAICYQLAKPAIHYHCLSSGVYQFSIPMS